jgi:thiamine biosynthesis lipoprotein
MPTSTRLLPCLILLACALIGTACRDHSPRTVRTEGRTMGTTWNIQLVLPTGQQNPAALIQPRLDELEALFTNWSSHSPVSRFNQSTSTDWQPVPKELAEVVTQALELSRHTQGAFDITLGPLIDLWGFGAAARRDTPPDEASIINAQARCGWHRLEVKLDPPRLRKTHADLQINVSALVEGYAADDIARRLESAGCHNFLLDVGGELLARGKKADGTAWQVGIQQPDAVKGEALLSMPLNNQALSTSGTYRQYFESDGHRYAHVLDGRTGRPITHHAVSVSVVADSCFQADSWSTALLALGPEEGTPLAKKAGVHAIYLEER